MQSSVTDCRDTRALARAHTHTHALTAYLQSPRIGTWLQLPRSRTGALQGCTGGAGLDSGRVSATAPFRGRAGGRADAKAAAYISTSVHLIMHGKARSLLQRQQAPWDLHLKAADSIS